MRQEADPFCSVVYAEHPPGIINQAWYIRSPQVDSLISIVLIYVVALCLVCQQGYQLLVRFFFEYTAAQLPTNISFTMSVKDLVSTDFFLERLQEFMKSKLACFHFPFQLISP